MKPLSTYRMGLSPAPVPTSNRMAEKSPFQIAVKRLEIDENVKGTEHIWEHIDWWCEMMRWIVIHLSPKPQMSDLGWSTIWTVVERPDRQCGNDLLFNLRKLLYRKLVHKRNTGIKCSRRIQYTHYLHLRAEHVCQLPCFIVEY